MSGLNGVYAYHPLLKVFQSPDGDSLCPDMWTWSGPPATITMFQSPDGDSLCPDNFWSMSRRKLGITFQSPDGDSLCPDDGLESAGRRPRLCFSPLTGILYVRTHGGYHYIEVVVPVSVP